MGHQQRQMSYFMESHQKLHITDIISIALQKESKIQMGLTLG